MKICAVTMVYRDYWALSQWYAHYSRHLRVENLYIISHGYDPEISRLCPKANVITVPRDDLSNFDTARGQMLNSFQDGLGAIYDWVIRTDADELIYYDPSKFASFQEVFLSVDESTSVFALGLNLVESDDCKDTPRDAVFTGHYSKAWAVKRGTHLMRHGIIARRRKLRLGNLTLPNGIYLFHLKYANISALASVNKDRFLVTKRLESGLPGTAWSKPTTNAENFYTRFSKLPLLSWNDASNDAFSKLSVEPVRDAENTILRARFIRFEHRTTVPDWFTLHID